MQHKDYCIDIAQIFTCFNPLPCNNDFRRLLAKIPFETGKQKEKVLLPSIFSFCHNVSIKNRNTTSAMY